MKEDVQEFLATPDVSCAPPLPLRAYPSSARVGPIKTGGRVFVLDHTRWTPPMKEAIDDLLQKHRGDKEMLRLVDQEYAAIVHRAAADPNSLLHPTSRLHVSRYVKHLAKLLNTSSSLNISPEKLRDTQQLWHSLTEGSESSHVPVVTVEPATFNPPASALSSPLTQHSLEKIVEGILSKQQQQQLPPGQKKRQRPVFPADSRSLDMKLMDPRSTFSINGGLCCIFTAHRRCIRAMLLKDSTLKCPLKIFQPLTFFRENWTQPRRECRRRLKRKGKGQNRHQPAVSVGSVTWS
uniref:Uncharacterized protein n=1 Tax=Nothobranchius rachovii TaxID=451742 RepID=A0A1A8PG05_9TELE